MKLCLVIPSALAVLAMCGSAVAQTTTNATVAISTNVTRTPEIQSSDINKFNLLDCLADGTITFGLTRTGFQTSSDVHLEIWAQNGVNCLDDQIRTMNMACWKVAEPANTDVTVDVRVQDIVAQGGVTLPATVDVCTDPPRSSESNFVLTFLIVNNGGHAPESQTPPQWPPMMTARFDVVGPTPPTNVTASPGGESAILSFDASTDDDVTGYNAFCVVAGEGSDAGACSAPGIEPGQVPDPAFQCGSTGSVSEGLTAEPLEDGKTFAIGVSARDGVNNPGPLSNIVCVTPKATTGYFEAYRAAGGTAGGGFCSLSQRASPLTAGGILVALAGLILRRRRQP